MKFSIKKAVSGFAMSICVAMSAHAIPLSDLLAGGSIDAGDKRFDQWTFKFAEASDNVYLIDPSKIDVSALNDGGDKPGPGLLFTFEPRTAGVVGDGVFAFTDYSFGFRVSSLVGKKIVGVSMGDFFGELDFLDGEDLLATVIEFVRDRDGNLLAQIDVTESILEGVEDYKGFDAATFAPQDEIFVVKNMLISSAAQGEGIWVSTFYQRFEQSVPEPGSLALVALALAGVGAVARRRPI